MGGDGKSRGPPMKSSAGSPPRGRGRLGHAELTRGSQGLTPAWAGTALPDERKCVESSRTYFSFARRRRLATLQPGRMLG